MPAHESKVEIAVPDHDTVVSGLLMLPADAIALLVLGHGAGAGMTHPFMEHLALQLADGGVGTLRYNFPFKEHDGKRPDRTAKLVAPSSRRASRASVTLRTTS